MCGIVGEYSCLKVESENLIKMTRALSHRGPDGQNVWNSDSGDVGLGHSRLSIIDLSDDGKQPMHYGERYVITFNGEIYNYIELKRELEAKGINFKSKSDTEVLLALYKEYGPTCLQKLDGMFAFVIYDKEQKRFFGARDRFGEKPLYYSYRKDSSFVFASEIKALFAYGIQKKVNNRMLANFLLSNYSINNPNDLAETFYANILKLPAAHYFTLDGDLNLQIKEYWKIDLTEANHKISFNEAKEEFKFLLSQSVNYRLRSDVPIGSSLSGGLDSSSIVCLINKINSEKKLKQNTFSARFKDFHKDEGKYIQHVTDQSGAKCYYTWPDEEGFIKDFENLLYFQDEPFPSASIYAQYCVMKKAKEEGVTVLLDGQGADEVLAGYEYYLQTYLNGLERSKSNVLEKELLMIVSNNANFELKEATQSVTKQNLSLKGIMKDVVRPVYKALNPKKYANLSRSNDSHSLLRQDFVSSLGENWRYDFSYDQYHLKSHLWFSVKHHNLEDLLRFSDRNAMAHSREVRLPFLNTKLVEFAFTLPAEFLIHQGWTKYILRESMKEILPAEITWRKDKIGYETPQRKWLQNSFFVEKIRNQKMKLINQGIINEDYQLNEENNWSVLMTEALGV